MHSIKKIIAQFFRHGQMSRYDRGTLLVAKGDGRGKRNVPGVHGRGKRSVPGVLLYGDAAYVYSDVQFTGTAVLFVGVVYAIVVGVLIAVFKIDFAHVCLQIHLVVG